MRVKENAASTREGQAALAQKQIQVKANKAQRLLIHFKRYFWLYVFLVPALLVFRLHSEIITSLRASGIPNGSA